MLEDLNLNEPCSCSVTPSLDSLNIGDACPSCGGGGGGSYSGIVKWDDVASKPSTFPPSPHTHVYTDITNFQEGLALAFVIDPGSSPVGTFKITSVNNPSTGFMSYTTYASSSNTGVLSSSDWSVFNSKYSTPTGTTSDYIRGDGSIAPFPTFGGTYFQQNLNTFGTDAILGTSDNFGLQFKTNNLLRGGFLASGGFYLDSLSSSATGLVLADLTGTLNKLDFTGDPNVFLSGDGNFYPLTVGLVPETRAITINGVTQDLSLDRIWDVGDILSTGSYVDPVWITSLNWSKITSTPTTLSGYGITDAVSVTNTVNVNGNLYPLSTTPIEWRTAQGDTGCLSFGGLSVASGTTINIGAVVGYIVNNETNPVLPSYTYINYAGATGVTVPISGQSTYVLIGAGNVITFQTTFPSSKDRKEKIWLGKISHPAGLITLTVNEPDYITSPLAFSRDLFQALGPYINEGVSPYANGANLNINITGGYIHGDGINFVGGVLNRQDPNRVPAGPTVVAQFTPRTRNGAGGAATTTLDVGNYDVGGVVTPIPGAGARSTIKYVYAVPTSLGIGYIIQYGQQFYATINDAIAAVGRESQVVFSNLIGNSILIGVIVARKDATTLNDLLQAQFFPADKLGQIGGSTSGVSVGTLQTAYLNSPLPQILITALGAFTVRNTAAWGSDSLSIQDWQNTSGITTASVTGSGQFTAARFATTGGLNSQFLKGDGTLDSNVYLTTISGIFAGGELTGTYPNPTLVNSAVINKVLTGLNLGTGGSILATDTILQAFGKIQNIISTLIGGVNFIDFWNASTNIPTIPAASPSNKGWYYIVDVTGSTNIDGITDWKVGDWIISNGTLWSKIDNTDAVSSVNGFTGSVNLTTANIPEVTNLYYTDARVRLAISETITGIDYNNTTGVFSLTAGYIIPTTASYNNANWDTAYANRIGSFNTSGNSGSATFTPGGLLNIPTYTLAGLGGAPSTGGTGYIQNQSSVAQTADAYISGSFRAGSITSAQLYVETLGSLFTDIIVDAIGDISFSNNSTATLQLYADNTAEFFSSVTATAFIVNVGASNQFLKGDGTLDSNIYWSTFDFTSTDISNWNTAYSNMFANPMVTNGDIIYGGASGTPTRLPVGTTGNFLRAGSIPTYFDLFGTGNNWTGYQTFVNGIGVSDSSNTLSFAAYGNGSVNGVAMGANGSGMPVIQGINSSTPDYSISVNPFGGSLIVGSTVNNGAKLQVVGSSIISTFSDGTIIGAIFNGNPLGFNGSFFGTTTNHRVGLFTNGSSPQVSLATTGNLLINTVTDNGTDKLQVNGSVLFSSTATATSFIKSGATSTNFLRAGGSDFNLFGTANNWTADQTATKWIKSGGLASEYLMADGSTSTGGATSFATYELTADYTITSTSPEIIPFDTAALNVGSEVSLLTAGTFGLSEGYWEVTCSIQKEPNGANTAIGLYVDGTEIYSSMLSAGMGDAESTSFSVIFNNVSAGSEITIQVKDSASGSDIFKNSIMSTGGIASWVTFKKIG